jgi:hypothetical protein
MRMGILLLRVSDGVVAVRVGPSSGPDAQVGAAATAVAVSTVPSTEEGAFPACGQDRVMSRGVRGADSDSGQR